MLSPSSSAPQTQTTGKRAFLFIFIVVLLDVVGLSILMPVQAYIVQQYSSEALMVTLLTVMYAAAQFMAAPLLGKLSDRYGRRPVLLICVLGSALGYFLFGIGGALWILFLSRLIDGFTGGNISTASAYIADVTPPEDRASSFGLIGAAFGLGFILGPTLGGALGQISLTAPAFAAGVFSLLSVLVGFSILPESLPKEARATTLLRWADLNPLASIAEMLRRPTLGTLLITQSIFFFVFNGINAIIPVLMIDKFSAQPLHLAGLFLIMGITNIAVQAVLIGPAAKRFGEKKLAVASFLIQAAWAIYLVSVLRLWALYPLSPVGSLGTGLIWATMGTLLANSVSAEERGKLSGVSTALGSLMGVFGPLWAGATYDHLTPAAPFWAGAILLVLAGLLLLRLNVATPMPGQAQARPSTS